MVKNYDICIHGETLSGVVRKTNCPQTSYSCLIFSEGLADSSTIVKDWLTGCGKCVGDADTDTKKTACVAVLTGLATAVAAGTVATRGSADGAVEGADLAESMDAADVSTLNQWELAARGLSFSFG